MEELLHPQCTFPCDGWTSWSSLVVLSTGRGDRAERGPTVTAPVIHFPHVIVSIRTEGGGIGKSPSSRRCPGPCNSALSSCWWSYAALRGVLAEPGTSPCRPRAEGCAPSPAGGRSRCRRGLPAGLVKPESWWQNSFHHRLCRTFPAALPSFSILPSSTKHFPAVCWLFLTLLRFAILIRCLEERRRQERREMEGLLVAALPRPPVQVGSLASLRTALLPLEVAPVRWVPQGWKYGAWHLALSPPLFLFMTMGKPFRLFCVPWAIKWTNYGGPLFFPTAMSGQIFCFPLL